MADDVLRSFVVQLGWKIDKEGERKVNETLTGITRSATVLVGALAAAAAAAATAAAKIAASFDQLYFVSQRTGASAKNIQSLSYAFDQVGSSGGNAVASIESFARAMRTNPGVASFVKSLGVATTAGGRARDSIDVLSDAIEKIQQRPYYVGAQYAELLGIDEATYETLVRYSKEIKDFRAEYERTARVIGLNSEEATKVSNKFWTALRSLQATVTAVAQKLAIDLVPALTAFVDKIRAWIEANPDKIRDGILAISAAVTGLAAGFMDVVEALTPVLKVFQSMAEMLTGKEGLQASFEAFAVFLTTVWLAKILGTFARVGVGWTGLLAALGIGGLAYGAYRGATEGFPQDKGNPNGESGPEVSAGSGITGGGLREAWRKRPKWLGGEGSGAGASGPVRPLGKVPRMENAKAIIATLREAGYNDNAIAAVVGSMETESSFNPRAHNDISGTHDGLWQWDRHRWPRIANWIKQQGGDPYDPVWQTKAWIAEHNAKPGDPMYDHRRTERGGAILRNNPSLSDAIHGVRESERFGAGEEGGRANNARRWLPHVQKPAAAPIGPLSFPRGGLNPGGFDVNGAMRAPPIGGSTTNNTSSRSLTNSPSYNVTIHTSGDAQATANAFSRSARDLNSEALRDIQALNR